LAREISSCPVLAVITFGTIAEVVNFSVGVVQEMINRSEKRLIVYFMEYVFNKNNV